jgi:16S rRNA (cytosine1402-N4)-methyltransferase
MSVTHEAVMVAEVMQHLALRPGHTAMDGTAGHAGHSFEMATRIAPGGRLIAFDWDEAMLSVARTKLSQAREVQIDLVNADFREAPAWLDEWQARPNGMLLDLGLNLAQIEDASRGITFREEGPLDMRMDRSSGETAAALLNRLSPSEIERILWEFGDERWAKRIAETVVAHRKEKPLRTTTDLVDCVLAAVPSGARDKHLHPATRTFQAVRIAVNHELDDLQETIEALADRLAEQGTLVILSYHSGEDRAAKNAFRSLSGRGFQEITRRPETPSDEEVRRNPRSRSAKLRALKRSASVH